MIIGDAYDYNIYFLLMPLGSCAEFILRSAGAMLGGPRQTALYWRIGLGSRVNHFIGVFSAI